MSKKSENSKKSYKSKKKALKVTDELTTENINNVEETIENNVIEEETENVVEEKTVEEPIKQVEVEEKPKEVVVEEKAINKEDKHVKKISKKSTKFKYFSSVWNGVEIDLY